MLLNDGKVVLPEQILDFNLEEVRQAIHATPESILFFYNHKIADEIVKIIADFEYLLGSSRNVRKYETAAEDLKKQPQNAPIKEIKARSGSHELTHLQKIAHLLFIASRPH